MTRTSLTEVVELFSNLERIERLEALVAFGDEMPALTPDARKERDLGRHIIHECQSPVFFRARVHDGRVAIQADVPREAPIARGFVGMLFAVFDGAPAASITGMDLSEPHGLLKRTKLDEVLTLQRQHGLSAIYAALLQATQESTPAVDATARSVSAIVLASGTSKRMCGKNKLLMTVRDKPMISNVVDALLENVNDAESPVNRVVLVLGFEANRVRDALLADANVADATKRGRLSIAINGEHAEGIASSVRASVGAAGALEHNARGVAQSSTVTQSSGFMFCLADMPYITADEYRQIARAFCTALATDPRAIVVPYHDEVRGNPVVLSADYRSEMLLLRGDSGCRPIIEQNPNHVRRVAMPTSSVLDDIDTLEALDALQSRS